MNKFLINWLISTLAIIIAAYLIPSVHVSSLLAALTTALVLGVINAVLKPFLIILTLPINVITLGLFTLVINALIVKIASWIVPGFSVPGFWPAVLFGLVLSLINIFSHSSENKRN